MPEDYDRKIRKYIKDEKEVKKNEGKIYKNETVRRKWQRVKSSNVLNNITHYPEKKDEGKRHW